MSLGEAIGAALREGGLAVGVLIFLAIFGAFDLPLPAKVPADAAIAKPLVALIGSLAAYRFFPRRTTARFLVLLLAAAAAVISYIVYHHFNDVPAPPDSVDAYVTGATIALALTYLFLGAVLRELIVGLFLVFNMARPRGAAKKDDAKATNNQPAAEKDKDKDKK